MAQRLDDLAQARGLSSRSEVIRDLILGASMEPADRETVPDRDELLELLGDSARGGSVTAMKTLLEEHRRDGSDDKPRTAADPIDELSVYRAKQAG